MNPKDRMLARLPKASQWYSIRAEADRAVVVIYEEIGYWGVTANDFARELAALDVDEIEVQINSPGGDVFDGLAIYNALRLHKARIVTRVDGLAASAASVIVQAGDHRVMVKSAQMMIHEAWGVAVGPADEIREFADVLDQQNDVIAGIYADRSGDAGGDVAHFKQLMAIETWLTDQAAIDEGLADELLDPTPSAKSAAKPSAVMAATQDPSALGLLARSRVRELFGDALADDNPTN